MLFTDALTALLHALRDSGASYYGAADAPDGTLPAARFLSPYYPAQSHQTHVEMISLMTGQAAFQINSSWFKVDTPRPHILLCGAEHTEHYLAPELPYRLFWVSVAPTGLNLHQTFYSQTSGYGQSAARLHLNPPVAPRLWACADTARPDTARFHYLLMEAIDYSLQHGVMAPDNYQADILTQIKQYLDDYYWREITLDDLGKMTHYSPGHLNAIFLRHFGQPIYTYLCQVRLQHAARLLQSGRMSIKNVAAAVGFQDQCYFSRYFRKHFGYPPSQAAGRAGVKSPAAQQAMRSPSSTRRRPCSISPSTR